MQDEISKKELAIWKLAAINHTLVRLSSEKTIFKHNLCKLEIYKLAVSLQTAHCCKVVIKSFNLIY